MFSSQGVDVARLFEVAGVDMAPLDQPDGRFGPEDISKLWELAVNWTGNPALGLDRELTAKYVNFDVVSYVMLSSPNLRIGLENFSRYLALISDVATFMLEPEGSNSWLVLGHIGNTHPVPRQRQEYGLLALLTLCQWVTRRDVRPLAAEFIFPDPVALEPYRRAFDCRVSFNQAATRLLVAASDLDAPNPAHDAEMFSLLRGVIEARLKSLGNASTSHRVSEEIIRQLHLGEPRRGGIARALALSERSLQRRLQQEGANFQQLLDDARRELACKYLAQERYSLGQITHLLGFSDESNFFRASKRWFGTSPGLYRRQIG